MHNQRTETNQKHPSIPQNRSWSRVVPHIQAPKTNENEQGFSNEKTICHLHIPDVDSVKA